jgi:hypothetical protein
MQRSLDSRFPRSARRKQRAEVQSELELSLGPTTAIGIVGAARQ